MGWTAQGLPDSKLDATMRGSRITPIAVGLAEAFNERYSVVSSWWGSPPGAITVPGRLGRIDPVVIGAFLDSHLGTLATYYIKHTDNSGDWEGQTSIPMWTEADLLAAIGDTARKLFSDTDYPVWECIVQAKKMLDLLIWTRAGGPTYGFCQTVTTKYRELVVTRASALTWAQAVTAFNALGWTVGTPGQDYNISHFGYQQPTGTTQWIIQRQAEQLGAAISTTGLATTVTAYAKLRYPGSGPYDQTDYPGVSAGTFATLLDETTPVVHTTTQRTLTGWAGEFGDASVSEPASGERRGWQTYETYEPIGVVKLDVTGGFEYVDGS